MHIDSLWACARTRVAPMLQPGANGIGRHTAYAVIFLLSVVAGRLTVATDSGVAMVWPAAGVAFVWFLTAVEAEGRLWGRQAAVVTALIFGITAPLNIVSGMDPGRSVVFAVGNAAAGFFGAWAYRWARPRREVALEGLSDIGALLGAASAAGVGSALWGPLYSFLVEDAPAALIWQAVTRNGIGTLFVGGVLLRLLSDPPRVPTPRRSVVVGLSVISTGLYWTALVPFASQPLTFLLTSVTVAAGVILTVDGFLVFVLLAGSTILGASVVGFGPFSLMGPVAEIFIAQAYIGVQMVIGSVLTLAREDLARLIQALRDSRSRAERQSELVGRVIGAMSEAVVAVEDGTVVLSNAAAERMFGLTVGTPVGGTPLAGGGTGGDLPLDRALAGEAAAQDLTLDRGRERRVVSVWAHPLGRESGHAVAVVRDVTAQRRQMADLTSFASVLAHDLLNPIGAVEGWLEVIEEECDPVADRTVATAAGRGRHAARRLREIVTGLHTYSIARGGELSLTEVDLQALAERLVGGRVAAAENTAGAVVPVCRVDARQHVMGDEALLAQIIDNLVGNAVKYTPPDAVPTITVSATPPSGGVVTVRVDDDGIGIPEEDRERVFEEFHRVDAHSKAYAGTGLGLSICRRMIERHGGTIRALESPQGGTRMEFTLPAVCPRRLQETAAEAEIRAAALQGRSASEAAHEALRRSAARTPTH